MRDYSTKKLAAIAVATATIYFFSNPKPNHFYDYTLRVAANFLRGSIGFAEKQPPWLNEFVPYDGLWYSVFPLGAVLSMLPFAALQVAGLITNMPSALISASLAGGVCFLLLKTAAQYELPFSRILLLTLAVLFGTFTWTNLTMGGAWQLALGFAMLGQVGAIYFTVYDRRPLLAGAFFALAFGNRTEILLTAPILLFLLNRPDADNGISDSKWSWSFSAINFRNAALFCIVPFVLGVATLTYNFVRFDSFTDFGYSRIPGVLEEPWYQHGIFSVFYIPRQAWEMLLKLWETTSTFPFILPDGFSSSILLSSPFLLLAFRRGGADRKLKYCAWSSIILITAVLWMHGNSGGWQFGYRYWMVCLPWLFVILLENSPKTTSLLEGFIFAFSFAANAFATWLFHWTSYIQPYSNSIKCC